ncbi:MAG: TVP38/TMEM64 family protein [Pseudomonadota bacterium]|nr:TVP38/TMEM64 family protein [Pseudomonadota bacterium]
MIEANGRQGAMARLGRFAPALVVVALLALAWAMGWFDHLSLSNLIMHRQVLADRVAGGLGVALVVYFLVYAALVAVSFPGASLLTLTAGFLFGGLLAGAVTVLAATLGAVVIFLIARSSFGDVLERRAGPFVARMLEGFRRDAFSYLLFLRLVPVFPFWVVNIVPGLVNMRLSSFVAATFLGIIPGTFAYAFIGAGLDSVIAAQERADPGCAGRGTCSIDPSALVTREMMLAMVALAVISVLPVIIRRWKNSDRAGG